MCINQFNSTHSRSAVLILHIIADVGETAGDWRSTRQSRSVRQVSRGLAGWPEYTERLEQYLRSAQRLWSDNIRGLVAPQKLLFLFFFKPSTSVQGSAACGALQIQLPSAPAERKRCDIHLRAAATRHTKCNFENSLDDRDSLSFPEQNVYLGAGEQLQITYIGYMLHLNI